jgi:hypothetical protein
MAAPIDRAASDRQLVRSATPRRGNEKPQLTNTTPVANIAPGFACDGGPHAQAPEGRRSDERSGC